MNLKKSLYGHKLTFGSQEGEKMVSVDYSDFFAESLYCSFFLTRGSIKFLTWKTNNDTHSSHIILRSWTYMIQYAQLYIYQVYNFYQYQMPDDNQFLQLSLPGNYEIEFQFAMDYLSVDYIRNSGILRFLVYKFTVNEQTSFCYFDIIQTTDIYVDRFNSSNITCKICFKKTTNTTDYYTIGYYNRIEEFYNKKKGSLFKCKKMYIYT